MEYENNFWDYNSWLHFVSGARIWISCARFWVKKQSHKYHKFRKFTNIGDFSIIQHIEPRIYVPSGRRPISYFFVSGSGMMPRTSTGKEKINMIFSAIFLLWIFIRNMRILALKSHMFGLWFGQTVWGLRTSSVYVQKIKQSILNGIMLQLFKFQ